MGRDGKHTNKNVRFNSRFNEISTNSQILKIKILSISVFIIFSITFYILVT